MCEGNTVSAVALKQLLLLVHNACEQIVVGIEEIVRLSVKKRNYRSIF